MEATWSHQRAPLMLLVVSSTLITGAARIWPRITWLASARLAEVVPGRGDPAGRGVGAGQPGDQFRGSGDWEVLVDDQVGGQRAKVGSVASRGSDAGGCGGRG